MELEANSELRLLHDSVYKCACELDVKFSFDERWKKVAGTGLIGLAVDPQFGGSGCGATEMLIALEALGKGNTDNGLSFAIAAHTLSCVIPINKYGTDAQKGKYLPGLINGDLIAANAMTEAESGSDVFRINCSANKSGDLYKINGVKTFISNSSIASLALVYASTNSEKGFFGGITAFIAESNQFEKGAEFRKMGLESCALGEIIFNDSLVGQDQILGKEGSGAVIFNESMEWERICLAGIHLGTMSRIMNKTIEFVKQRKSLGQSIGKFQGISHLVADMQVSMDVARAYTYQTARKMDQHKKVGMEAAITKLFVSNTLKKFMLNAMQIFGGYGYIADYGIEKEVRDALASTIYSGTSEIQKNIIVANLGL